MLTWVSGLYNDHLIQHHLLTVVCMSLPRLTNGGISYSDQTLGLNTVVTYTCDTGYTLNGGTTRTCGRDGVWSGFAPNCLRKWNEICTVCLLSVLSPRGGTTSASLKDPHSLLYPGQISIAHQIKQSDTHSNSS